ncbi:Ldh family oxidoreductase [Pseudonocardia eucalypti]|uniref:Ldh family oxidoreductase n=1 Tax=Pseudonocardia eucalypti TaxID=648755 RepID=A0ABP9QIT3_9PSEU|nr:LDH2 family malate/lactate/ureidoglycolate dehydrogenase [Pseudonocardia eucalypti]
MTAEQRVSAERLAEFAARVLRACQVPPADAELVADSLVAADLWGHQSHGVLRLGWYVDRLRSGVMNTRTEPELVVDAGAVATLDGGDGVGQVLAARAATEAIERAGRHGVGVVAVRNSNHFGTAAYFTRMAPPRGCIGLLATNASAAMAPWGGREKRVGSNPWSIAAPLGGQRQLVLDIANTAVARGKIYLADNRGEPIPAGWAMAADGRPTTDPREAIAGLIMPMAEHKGYAISVMMDVLAGVLTGSGFGAGIKGPYQAAERSGAGHLYLALDIAAFLPVEEFVRRANQLVDELKATPPAPGASPIRYPGEGEMLAEQRHRAAGLELPAQTVADLDRVAAELGLRPLAGNGEERPCR